MTDKGSNATELPKHTLKDLQWAALIFAFLFSVWDFGMKLIPPASYQAISQTSGFFEPIGLAAIAGLLLSAQNWTHNLTVKFPRSYWLTYPLTIIMILAPVLSIPDRLNVCPAQGCSPSALAPTPAPAITQSAPAGPSTPVPRDGDPDDVQSYLSGNVEIGINGCLPGWSYSVTAKPENCTNISTKGCNVQPVGSPFRPPANCSLRGFDVDLAFYLAWLDGFRPVFVPLTQQQRLSVWTNPDSRIKLVISTFSIDRSRQQTEDFAGPYWYDVTSIWRNAAKLDAKAGTTVYGCAVDGTHSYTAMTSKSPPFKPFSGKGNFLPEYRQPHLAYCLNRYLTSSDRTDYIGSDWSILRAYFQKMTGSAPSVVEASDPDKEVTDDDVEPNILRQNPPPSATKLSMFPTELEQYGIALEKYHPIVKGALCEGIKEFLRGSPDFNWETDYRENLKESVPKSWHKPDPSELSACD